MGRHMRDEMAYPSPRLIDVRRLTSNKPFDFDLGHEPDPGNV